MGKNLKHITSIAVLAIYILVGIMGGLEVLTRYFNSPPDVLAYQPKKPTQPTPCKIYWTQHKHIPSSPKTIVLSQALLTEPAALEQKDRSQLISQPVIVYHTSSQISVAVSRAPPTT